MVKSQDNSVIIVTLMRAERPRNFISVYGMAWYFFFFKESRTKTLYPAIKEQENEIDRWPPPDICVKNTRNNT